MSDLRFTPVIGLEVHVELLTRSKCFCGCRNLFGAPPNSLVCPVCLGMPGSLPVLNRHAMELAVRTGLALTCRIAEVTRFDRKNYFYPDLPKNYQISQYDQPLARDGFLEVGEGEARRKIRILRVHLEEDTGKLVHTAGATASFADYNRSGVPLLEIVGHPDIVSPEEARDYLTRLKQLLRYLEVSDCNMEEGSLRCDANVNVRIETPSGPVFTPIVELKNINSFRMVERALRYEVERQTEQWRGDGLTKGEKGKTTRGWDDPKGVSVLQREKEDVADYRYFPEPDLPPFVLAREWVDGLRARLPEFPAARRQRYQSACGLSEYDARTLTNEKEVADYYEESLRAGAAAKEAANWVLTSVLKIVNEKKVTLKDFPVTPACLAGLLRVLDEGKLSVRMAREVFDRMAVTGQEAVTVMQEGGFSLQRDESAIAGMIDKVLTEHAAGAVADYRAGKTKAFAFLVGQVMKRTRGQAAPEVLQRLLKEKLVGG